MIDEKLFIKIADTNFHIFEITSLKDIENINKIYPRKEMIRDLMKEKVKSKFQKIELPEKTTIEIYLLLSEFIVKNKIEPLEACALFKIISDVLSLIRKKRDKKDTRILRTRVRLQVLSLFCLPLRRKALHRREMC